MNFETIARYLHNQVQARAIEPLDEELPLAMIEKMVHVADRLSDKVGVSFALPFPAAN